MISSAMLSFLRRWRKYAKLHGLSREFRTHYGRTRESGEAFLRQVEEDDRLMDEFFSLIEADRECSALLVHYNAGRQVLNSFFWDLMKTGAGQWAGGRFIPFFALAEPWTLEYLLRHRSHSFSGTGIGEKEAFRLVVYYQDGKGIDWLQA